MINSTHGTVSMPSDYFAKSVKNNYCSVTWALWRELLQNSLDANSTKIDIKLEEIGGDLVYTCSDNGCGMSQKTMEDFLLTFGGTHKKDNSVGGFGEAKILILFAMQKYSVHSRDVYAQGSGLNYTIEKRQKIKGTIFSGVLPKSWGYSYSNFLHSFYGLINSSRLDKKIKITFNGELFACPKGTGKTFFNAKVDSTDVCCKVSVGDGNIYVMHKGLFMFEMYDYNLYKSRLNVHMWIGNSIDFLTSSRDRFTQDKKKFVDEIVNLASSSADGMAACVSVEKNLKIPSYGNGFLMPPKTYNSIEKEVCGFIKLSDFSNFINGYFYVDLDRAFLSISKNKKNVDEWCVALEKNIPNEYKKDAIMISSKKIEKKYFLSSLNKVNSKMLKKFKCLTSLILREFCPKKENEIKFGFIFDEDIMGLYETEGFIYYNPKKIKDRKSLLEVCVHECAHAIGNMEHDSYFANNVSKIFSWLIYSKEAIRFFNSVK